MPEGNISVTFVQALNLALQAFAIERYRAAGLLRENREMRARVRNKSLRACGIFDFRDRVSCRLQKEQNWRRSAKFELNKT
jgi:hypothetical protein